jgi:SAM-dependent methyltransferase
MFELKTANFILRNRNIFEKTGISRGLATRFLVKHAPLVLSDLKAGTKFNNSYALRSEKDSELFYRVMRRLESYVGAGPFGYKKYWEYPWALINLKLAPAMSVLDAGCGRSPVQYLMADLGLEVTGVDLFEGVEWHGIDRQLARICSRKIEYKKESLDNLSFADNNFDRVCCLSVLEHCRASATATGNDKIAAQSSEDKALQRKIISELARVLKPGGLLVITVDFNIPRDNCLLESNIDVRNIIESAGLEAVGARCLEPFPGETGFDRNAVIDNGDIYLEDYLGTLQTAIGLVLRKKR